MARFDPIPCRALCGRTHAPDRLLCPACWKSIPPWVRFGVHDTYDRYLDARRRGLIPEAWRLLRSFRDFAALATDEAFFVATHTPDGEIRGESPGG